MRWSVTNRVTNLAVATGVALLTAQFYPRNLYGYAPALAEVICWSLVTVSFGFSSRFVPGLWKNENFGLKPSIKYLYWIVAGSVSMVAALSSVIDSTWVTPVVGFALIARSRTAPFARLSELLPSYIKYTCFVSGLGAALVVALAPTFDTVRIVYAVPTALGLVGIYGSLADIFNLGRQCLDGGDRMSTGNVIRSISFRTVGLCIAVAIFVVLSPFGGTSSMVKALFAGIVKALHWTAVLWLTQEVQWEVAPVIWAYVTASADAFTPDATTPLGGFQTLARTTIAILSLYQVVSFLPKSSKGRLILYLFAIWPVLSLVRLTSTERQVPSLPEAVWPYVSTGTVTPSSLHPVEELALKARKDFAHLQKRQSKTLRSAEKEYRRRNSREPPPGFNKWFFYAKANQSPLIDDFDMINEDLKPFWKIEPRRLRESINNATELDHLALRKCAFADGEYNSATEHWLGKDLGGLFDEVSRNIPDVVFALNLLDEPRFTITRQTLNNGGTLRPSFEDANHNSIWDKTNDLCWGNPSVEANPFIFSYGLPFVQDKSHAQEVCSHPEFESMHGFFFSPMTGLTTEAPIPILSQAAPSSFGDIIYPSPWYTDKVYQGDYKEVDDPAWEAKNDNLYWAGSTTGSYSWNSSWHHSHRQRFVKLVQTIDHTSHTFLKQSKLGQWIPYSAVKNQSSLYDVKFTAVLQCNEQDCKDQKEFFNPGDIEEQSQQLRSRFVFDIDGNSFGGRYYTLLQSRSVVLKQTILREWHDERLIPWVHYIPVSLSMDELPEIMRYLTSHEDGKRRAKEIADASREWHGKALRREDFTIYLYRLMLELARTMDPNREVE